MTQSYLIVADISDRDHPLVVASIFYGESHPQNIAPHLRSLALSSNHAYVAADDGLNIYDVSDPRHPVLRAKYERPGLDILDFAMWGTYAVCAYTYWKWPESSTRSYGVEVIDVSLPSAPILIGAFELGKDLVPQDIEVSGAGFAYICQSNSGHNSGQLTVLDVASDPAHPSEVGRYFKSGEGYEGITLFENYVYLVPISSCRMITLSISNPRSPAYVGECETRCNCWDLHGSGNRVGISHGGGGFSLYDVALPGKPVRLGTYWTPDTLGLVGNGIAARGKHVYMACNSDGLRIIDVSDPSNPREAGVSLSLGPGSGLAVSGRYAYGVDRERLSIFDISSPDIPEKLADLAIPLIDSACDYRGHCGVAVRPPYAYVSGTERKASISRATLTVIDVSDPADPRVVSTLACADNAEHFGTLALSGHYIYLPVSDYSQGADDRRSGFRVIDVANPGNPGEVYIGISNILGSESRHVVVKGNYAYLTGDLLRIFDLSNPAFPSLVVSYGLRCVHIAVSGDYAYLAWDKLWIIDISNIYRSSTTAVHYAGEWGKGVAVSGNIVYMPGSLSVLKNKLAPDLSIAAPSVLSTVLGSVPIEVQASHSSGIDHVEFYIDDSFKSSDPSAPYSYNWDTTPLEDGLHTIRVRAVNNNGKSSEAETEVFTRLVYAPQNFAGEKRLNRSLSQAEYVNILSWQAHPSNVDVVKYRLFRVDGRSRSLLAELKADTLQYWHRKVEKDKEYTYSLIAVNNQSRESEPIFIAVK